MEIYEISMKWKSERNRNIECIYHMSNENAKLLPKFKERRFRNNI